MARNSAQWQQKPKLPPSHWSDPAIYSDPEIFEEEKEKIFKKTWKLACHESELPDAGDYRTLEWAGTPLGSGATVTATVVAHGKHDKVRIFKMRRRKHYQKRQGHRQQFTELEIGAIAA